jgi:hypothetical protein
VSWTRENHRTRCLAIARVCVAASLCAAFAIYVAAGQGEPQSSGYLTQGGQVLESASADSKQYLRNMELYGGKANVMAAEARMWLAEMFSGRTLAFTVGGLGLAVGLGFFVLAGFSPGPPPGGPDDFRRRGRPD